MGGVIAEAILSVIVCESMTMVTCKGQIRDMFGVHAWFGGQGMGSGDGVRGCGYP